MTLENEFDVPAQSYFLAETIRRSFDKKSTMNIVRYSGSTFVVTLGKKSCTIEDMYENLTEARLGQPLSVDDWEEGEGKRKNLEVLIGALCVVTKKPIWILQNKDPSKPNPTVLAHDTVSYRKKSIAAVAVLGMGISAVCVAAFSAKN